MDVSTVNGKTKKKKKKEKNKPTIRGAYMRHRVEHLRFINERTRDDVSVRGTRSRSVYVVRFNL